MTNYSTVMTTVCAVDQSPFARNNMLLQPEPTLYENQGCDAASQKPKTMSWERINQV